MTAAIIMKLDCSIHLSGVANVAWTMSSMLPALPLQTCHRTLTVDLSQRPVTLGDHSSITVFLQAQRFTNRVSLPSIDDARGNLLFLANLTLLATLLYSWTIDESIAGLYKSLLTATTLSSPQSLLKYQKNLVPSPVRLFFLKTSFTTQFPSTT